MQVVETFSGAVTSGFSTAVFFFTLQLVYGYYFLLLVDLCLGRSFFAGGQQIDLNRRMILRFLEK